MITNQLNADIKAETDRFKNDTIYTAFESENIRQKVGDELFGLFEHVTF